MHETDPKRRKSRYVTVYILIMAALLILNLILIPNLFGNKVTSVDYGTFLDMLESKNLTLVQLEDQVIYFMDKDGKAYSVNSISQDYNIVERLRSSGVAFGRVYQQTSALETFLLEWLLPMGSMILIGYLLMRWMTKKMAGGMGGGANSMMFGGKSGAKQYVVDESASIRFSDVAGEDEAKEALQ